MPPKIVLQPPAKALHVSQQSLRIHHIPTSSPPSSFLKWNIAGHTPLR